MSTLIQLSNEVGTHLLAAHPSVSPAEGGEGFLDLLTKKNTQTQTLFRAIAVTIGIGFVILQAIMSRGAMARIIVSIIAAGVFVWGVWNVTSIKDRVGNEMSWGATVTEVSSTAATPLGIDAPLSLTSSA